MHLLANKELNELYLSTALRWLAVSMISVFVPIYFLRLGYGFSQIMLFYFVMNLTHVTMLFPAARFAAKLGYKHSIASSIPFALLYFILLHSLDKYAWPIYLIAMIFGINNALFWTGYHIDFTKFSSRENREQEVCFSRVVWITFNVAGPLIGGSILFYTQSFKLMFMIVSILMIVSAIPLFSSKDIHDPLEVSWKKVFYGHKTKNYLAFIGYGIESGVALILWPMYIYYYKSIIGDFSSLGGITSLSLFTSAIVIVAVARYSKNHRRKTLRTGSVLHSLIWVFRSFIKSVPQLIVVDALYGISKSMISIPFHAMTYDKAIDGAGDKVRFIIFKEGVLNFAKACLFLLMVFIPGEFLVAFILAAVTSLFYGMF
jgi:hypothetical protein